MIDHQKIRKFGTIYRGLEQVENRHVLSGVGGHKNWYGRQILSAAHLDQKPLNHLIEIENQTRQFPRPKFAIGQVVECCPLPLEEDEPAILIITGMKYRQTSYELPIGWWYEAEELEAEESFHTLHETDLKIGPIPEQQFKDLDEEEQAILDTFLDNFECSNGPLFPYEEVRSS
ncbi:hypothetical protein BI308_23090 [Roseofilum reptotaenium AO1-A]|uniref:Uncharacterized protein n=1 Tax=Roseofilum reptotaenium AO1-A TaxID=1925591 RepID=A0A1L9QKI7_9CYAN|nr:hypothetical protein BI308_23090 [Roseofilum reptotaenium AO1-A]